MNRTSQLCDLLPFRQGPGKFWDPEHVVPSGPVSAQGGVAARPLDGPLAAIFADSLPDLEEIVRRVLDFKDCHSPTHIHTPTLPTLLHTPGECWTPRTGRRPRWWA